MDHTCRDRLLFEHGIPEDRVRVLPNFVDLDRFAPRAPLPKRPARGLVFTNGITDSQVANIRVACRQAGIEIDVLGNHSGTINARPEEILGDYDLVFAKARAALEAMAVGAAVVLCDQVGCGPMVTADQLDRLRTLNFGIRTLASQPVTAEAVARQIARYDPSDAAAVSAKIRREASLGDAVESIESLYRETIAEFEATTGSDTDGEMRAASEYLRWISPWLKNGTALLAERNLAQENLDRLEAELNRRMGDCLQIEGRLSQALADRDRVIAQLDRIEASKGWRLLSRYGVIKHRLFIPVLRNLGLRKR